MNSSNDSDRARPVAAQTAPGTWTGISCYSCLGCNLNLIGRTGSGEIWAHRKDDNALRHYRLADLRFDGGLTGEMQASVEALPRLSRGQAETVFLSVCPGGNLDGGAPDGDEIVTMGDSSHITDNGRDYWAVNLFTHQGNMHFAEVTGFTRQEAERNARRTRDALNRS